MRRQWHGIDLGDDDVMAMLFRVNEKIDAATALINATRAISSHPDADPNALARALALAEKLVGAAKAELSDGVAPHPAPDEPGDRQ
jgi:hypothetical protein